jgi:hypothetical protein
MPTSTENALHELEILEFQRRELLLNLAQATPFVVGTLTVARRTCGKPYCHCNKKGDPGHPTSVLQTGPAGRRRGQVVRKGELESVRGKVELYRSYREGLRRLRQLEAAERRLLRALITLRDEGYE